MLTPKQELYIQNVVKGMSQRDAYKNSYNAKNMSDRVIDNEASKLFNSHEVSVRYNELLQKAQNEAIMSARERMVWLSDVVKDKVKDTVYYNVNGESTPIEKTADLSTKIKAVDTLNKMSGEYKTIVEGNVQISYEEALKSIGDKDEF